MKRRDWAKSGLIPVTSLHVNTVYDSRNELECLLVTCRSFSSLFLIYKFMPSTNEFEGVLVSIHYDYIFRETSSVLTFDKRVRRGFRYSEKRARS